MTKASEKPPLFHGPLPNPNKNQTLNRKKVFTMLTARELLLTKTQLEAAVDLLSKVQDSPSLAKSLSLIGLPANTTLSDAKQQLSAVELLIDIKNDPISMTPEGELEAPESFFGALHELGKVFAGISEAEYQLSMAPGYQPALNRLNGFEGSIALAKGAAGMSMTPNSELPSTLTSDLREFESIFEALGGNTAGKFLDLIAGCALILC